MLTTIGIALGVGSFAGVLSISRSIIYGFEQSVLRTVGRAQLQVSNGTAGVDADLVSAIAALPEIEFSSGTVQYDVLVPELDRRITVFGVLFGADHSYREAQFGKNMLRIPDGGTFVVRTDSVAPSTSMIAEQGWALGTRIQVVGPKGPRTLTVRGSVDGRGTLSVFGGDVAVMDSEAAQDAFGELDRFHWIDVVVAGGTSLEIAQSVVSKVVGARGVVQTPFGRSRKMEAMLGTLRWMLTACGTIAMLVGVFLIHHTVSTAVRQRQGDFSKLRAIGATRRMVAGTIVAEAAVVGALGALLGVAAGIGFASVAVRAFGNAVAAMYVSVPPPPVTLTPWEFFASFALGEGTVILAATLPSARLLRLRPLTALASHGTVRAASNHRRATVAGTILLLTGLGAARLVPRFTLAGGVTMVTIFAACIFLGTTLLAPLLLRTVAAPVRALAGLTWGRLGLWMWQQVRRNGFNTGTTMGSLAAAVAFTIGLTTLLGSYRAAVERWISQTLTADVFVNAGGTISLLSGPTVPKALREEIEQVEGVDRVMPWRFIQVQFRDRPIIVQAAAEEMIRRWHPDVTSNPSGSEVVVSDSLAERLHLAVDDTLTVPAPVSPLVVQVAAIRPDYLLDLGNLKLSWTRFVRHFGEQGANILFVDAEDSRKSHKLKREIERLSVGRYDVTVMTSAELRKMMNALIDQSFALTTALQIFAALITVLAMINATSATILDRANELATWRALGLERRRLVRLLVGEASLVGALAAVLGVAGGILIGDTLVRVVAPAVAGFRMAVEWPLDWMIGVIVLTALCAGMPAAIVARTQMPRPIILSNALR